MMNTTSNHPYLPDPSEFMTMEQRHLEAKATMARIKTLTNHGKHQAAMSLFLERFGDA